MARDVPRIDTRTNATAPIGVLGFRWADLTVAYGAVWASSTGNRALIRLDPLTGEENERITLGPAPDALAAGRGAVWAAMRKTVTVARYDIKAERLEKIDVGGTPNDLVFAHGSVWVAVR